MSAIGSAVVKEFTAPNQSFANVSRWPGAGSGLVEFIAILPTVKMPKSMSGLEWAV